MPDHRAIFRCLVPDPDRRLGGCHHGSLTPVKAGGRCRRLLCGAAAGIVRRSKAMKSPFLHYLVIALGIMGVALAFAMISVRPTISINYPAPPDDGFPR